MYFHLKEEASILARIEFLAHFLVTRCFSSTCVWMGSKLQHQSGPRQEDMALIADNSVTTATLRKLEFRVFRQLGFFFAMLDVVELPECILACFAGLPMPKVQI